MILKLLIFISSIAFSAQPLNLNRDMVLGNLLKTRLEFYHYLRPQLTEEKSNLAFKNFIESVDAGKQFLLQEDVIKLEKYRTSMTNSLKEGKYPLLEESTKIYKTRLAQIESMIKKILIKPFPFNVDESMETNVKKRKYATNLIELEDIWRKTLKYSTLNNYMTFFDLTQKNDFTKIDKAIEKKSREKVKKSYLRMINRLKQEDHNDGLDKYFNAITQAIDPHTNYFPPKKKNAFDIEISNQLEGIGAILGVEGDFIKVVQIVIGSASWKQKELEPEDIILKVAQGKKEPVDIVNMRIDDAVQLVRGKKGTEVRLTVKKPNGMIKVISIIRDIVKVEEALAKSAILNLDGTKEKIGYIYLPKFYRDFDAAMNDRPSRNCTDDVKAEIIKLKKQNVDGLILDLRDNGGGALLDAEFMSGLFVKGGPIVQVKYSNDSIEVLKDDDKSIEYEGKLIVMVNRLSASSSEILAGALQDYNRALIVGPGQSYGKGTVQQYLNLDMGLNDALTDLTPLGALKITIQKFYRITGSSTQFKGIIPDVILPDPYAHLEFGERFLDNALAWDEVSKVKFTPWTENSMPSKKLQELSTPRVEKSVVFKNVVEITKKMKERKDQSMQTLHLAKALKEQQELEEEMEKFKNDELNPKFHVWTEKTQWVKGIDEEYNKELLEKKKKKSKLSDPLEGELNVKEKIEKAKKMKEKQETYDEDLLKEWIRSIRKDPYLEETVHIMNDYLKIK